MANASKRRGAQRTDAAAGESLLEGRYQLDEMLGRGAIATVFRAVDTVLDRPVAVKLLHPQLCEIRFVERFLEMERRMGRVFHPNLVTIFDAGATDSHCFAVMEYVGGGTLRDLLRNGKPLPQADVVRIVSQLAAALQVLHDEGIIHGEIKPSNVLLDDEGNAVLTDFGIVHLATTTGVMKVDSLTGSAPYLAPEQLEQGQTDRRSDLYALGILTYELLTGQQPFEGENWIAVATERLTRDPRPLDELRPDLPPELSRVLARALARDPDQRFGSAAEFGKALLQVPGAPDGPAGSQFARQPLDTGAWQPTAADTPPRDRHIATAPTRRVRRSAVEEPAEAAPTEWKQPRGGAPAAAPIAAPPPKQTAPAARPLGPPPHEPRAQSAREAKVRPAWWARVSRFDPVTRVILVAIGLSCLVVLLGGLAVAQLRQPPREVAVPRLVGQPLDAATGAARQAGLGLDVSEEHAESAPRGTVLRQEPAPDTTLRSNQPVRLVVSAGPPPVKAPSLERRRLEDARQDLAALGLGIGKVQEREVADRPPGTIVEQSVKPDTELGRGGTIDVVIAQPPRADVPKLVDRSLGDAEAELEKRGLRIGKVQLQPAAGKKAGTVLAQDPAPETVLRRGDAVSLSIAVPPQE